MAGEVIIVQVGQAGNQVSGAFWKKICQEHGLDHKSGKPISGDQVKGEPEIFFNKIGNKYVPRAVIVDLEPAVVENVKKDFQTLFDPKSIISGVDGAGNNFAIGYNEMGMEYLDNVMQVVEQRVSETEALGGFIITHSIGGGTGSGFGSRIIRTLRERYPKIPIMTFSIFPSPRISETVVEPYNAILSLSELSKYASASIVLDNEALYRIASERLNVENPSLKDLNLIISQVMVNITASIRFSGTMNVDLAKMVTNLVPYESLNFFLASTAPLVLTGQESYENYSIQDLSLSCFDKDNMLAAINPEEGKYLAASVLFRGEVLATEVNEAMSQVKEQYKFVDFIPTGFKVSKSEVAPADSSVGVVLLANNTGIVEVFERILASFDKLWSRKAFAFWYTDNGFEEADIDEAANSVRKLIERYKGLTEKGEAPSVTEDGGVA
ncbi:MAG: tubulin beta chain [Promethearchaeota archaeon]